MHRNACLPVTKVAVQNGRGRQSWVNKMAGLEIRSTTAIRQRIVSKVPEIVNTACKQDYLHARDDMSRRWPACLHVSDETLFMGLRRAERDEVRQITRRMGNLAVDAIAQACAYAAPMRSTRLLKQLERLPQSSIANGKSQRLQGPSSLTAAEVPQALAIEPRSHTRLEAAWCCLEQKHQAASCWWCLCRTGPGATTEGIYKRIAARRDDERGACGSCK